MKHRTAGARWLVLGCLFASACGGGGGQPGAGGAASGSGAGAAGVSGGSGSPAAGGGAGRAAAGNGGAGRAAAGSGGAGGNPAGGPAPSDDLPPAGNPSGNCQIPADARAEDTSQPTRVVGSGTPASCTSQAFVSAVAAGGIITFECGPAPVTITLTETAKVVNDKGPKIVIDGGGKVTLSGGDKVRILYQNTCDQGQKWTTSHCDDQDHPQLTVQNLTFVHGSARGTKASDPGGGGAIFVRGGQLKVINSRFFNNSCDDFGPDIGGAAVRAFDQYQDRPLYVVNSTFGGRSELANVCSNGGGLSSIGVSYTVLNSLFTHNRAIGDGANPMRAGTEGGGSGGAIYNDGNTFTLTVCGTRIENNHANEGGGAVFYVSNDDSGTLIFRDSALRANPSEGFETPPYKGVFVKTKVPVQATNTTFE